MIELQVVLNRYLDRNNDGGTNTDIKTLFDVYVGAGRDITPAVLDALNVYVGADDPTTDNFNDTYLDLLIEYRKYNPGNNLASITLPREALDELDALNIKWSFND